MHGKRFTAEKIINMLREAEVLLSTGKSAGGTVKEGVIEIQGDHREKLTEELKKKGWTVKRSGG